MEWFVAAVVVVVLGVAALVAAGGLGQMSRQPVRDTFRPDLPPADQPLRSADIAELRFGTALRGYVMTQVDDALDRLAREVADRDAVIAELRGSDSDPPQAPPAAAGDASVSTA
jgi:DivIVA domain-containing protein